VSGRVVLSGASGLVGAALVRELRAAGSEVVRLVRRAPAESGEARWDPERGEIDPDALRGATAIIHLSGESIAQGRWTAEKKRRLVESRIKSTDILARAAAAQTDRPNALVCASAVGFYGDRGDAWLDETSARGSGFLADLCAGWEAAAAPAKDAKIRTVHMRLGVVLAPSGGALASMLPAFRRGGGGKLGSGEQFTSWITLDDAVRAFALALQDGELHGAVNVCTPSPVTNAELTRALGRALRRPTLVTIPAFALRLAVGEMADEVLLASQRVRPSRLLARGFEFRFPHIDEALRHVLAG
jgi:hypothetical protein